VKYHNLGVAEGESVSCTTKTSKIFLCCWWPSKGNCSEFSWRNL